VDPYAKPNGKGILKYTSEERMLQDQIKNEKKAEKKMRRKTYLIESLKKLNKDINIL
jgi:hypothetical protein